MFCPKCGTKQTPVGRVCIKCNAPLSSTAKIDTSSSSQQAQQKSAQQNQNFNPQQGQNILPLQNQQPLYQPQNQPIYAPPPSQPAPPPWSSQTTEEERPKMAYPSVEMSKPDTYSPGQYLQPYQQNYQLGNQNFNNQFNNQNFFPPNNSASNRAIWGLVFSILSFAFCPILAAMIGVTLSYQELEAIEKGLAPPAGKPLAQIGYYLGMANMVLYAIGICLIFLLTII